MEKGKCEICSREKELDTTQVYFDFGALYTEKGCEECHNRLNKLRKIVEKFIEKQTEKIKDGKEPEEILTKEAL